jgi:hypothetical protein
MHGKSNPVGHSFDQDLLLRGWFDHHPMSTWRQEYKTHSGDDVESFIGYTWPMSTPYFNPFGAAFLIQLQDQRILHTKRIWLVRDGRVPLVWFFRRFPKPDPEVQAKLMIDEDMLTCIPVAWRPHISTYRLVSNAPATKESRVAILGLASESYCSLDYLEKKLKQISAIEKSERIKMDMFLPVRTGSGDESDHVYHPDFFRRFFKVADHESRVFSYYQMVGTFDMQNLRLYDISDKMLLSDNAMVHELLKKGAQWPVTEPTRENEEYVPLSAFHGYAINHNVDFVEPDWDDKSLRTAAKFESDIAGALNSQAFKFMPWPKWFSEWVSTKVEEKPAEISPVLPEPRKVNVLKKNKKAKTFKR